MERKESKALGRFIKDHRVMNNESQDSLANFMRKGIETIINWETGKSTPTFANFCRICEHYGIDFESLLFPQKYMTTRTDRVMEYFRKMELACDYWTALDALTGSDESFTDYMREYHPDEKIPEKEEVIRIMMNHPEESGYGVYWE